MSRIDDYRGLAEALLKAHQAGDAQAARRFVLYHPQFRNAPRDVVLRRPAKLADAQLVVAREARFESWPELRQGLERVEASEDARRFETAADAVVSGDLETLRRLQAEDPALATARSGRPHRATLLHYVAANGIEDHRQTIPPNAVAVADLLVAAGADINATAQFYGGGPGSTALVGLVTSGHPAEAGLMDELVRSFAASGQNLNGVDDDGIPILYALQSRHFSAARTLAECGARVDNLAVAAGIGRADLVEALIDDSTPPGADPGSLSEIVGETIDRSAAVQYALMLAAAAGESEIVRFLIERGTDVNACLQQGRTALHEAASGDRLDCVELLVEAGADAEIRDDRHRATPVGWAAEGGHSRIVDFLVDSTGVDFIDLVRLGREDLVRKRLDERTDDVNQGRGVPLWAAAAAGDLEMVRLLLEQGADPTLTDPDGRTALDWATELGHREIVAVLRRRA